MSTIFAPVTGETVNKSGDGATGGWVEGRWVPGSRPRATLHDVRMSRVAPQEEAPPQPIETPAAQTYYPPQSYETPVAASSNFTQGGDMAGNNGARLRMPNADDFDLYDDEGQEAYHRAVDAYIDSRVSAALTPSRQQQTEAEAVAQYNRTFERFGDDSNFKAVLDEALQRCLRDANAGRPIDIEQAYAEASESVSRRPGQRTSHLPSKARTVRDLGKIIEHNHKSGRAKPYRGR